MGIKEKTIFQGEDGARERMWFEEKMLPWVKMSSRKRQFLKEEMGLKRRCGLGKRCCPKVKMGAWMRLRKGWAYGKDIPQGEDWVEEKMTLKK